MSLLVAVSTRLATTAADAIRVDTRSILDLIRNESHAVHGAVMLSRALALSGCASV